MLNKLNGFNGKSSYKINVKMSIWEYKCVIHELANLKSWFILFDSITLICENNRY